MPWKLVVLVLAVWGALMAVLLPRADGDPVQGVSAGFGLALIALAGRHALGGSAGGRGVPRAQVVTELLAGVSLLTFVLVATLAPETPFWSALLVGSGVVGLGLAVTWFVRDAS